jgi:two-component system, sensor histidine kinase PdtaS
MQADAAKSEEARAALEESRSRVHSMARLQECLYQSLEAGAVHMADYLRDLGQTLRKAYGRPEVGVAVDVEEIVLDVERALSCGLLVNELATNGFKHAFPQGYAGEITISLRREGERYVLMVADTGLGLPPALDIETASSLGMRIIRTVRQKLHGALAVKRTPHTEFSLAFPLEEERTAA